MGAFLTANGTLEHYSTKLEMLLNSSIHNEANRSFDDGITIHQQEESTKLFSGYLLLNSQYINNPASILVNNQGDVVHSWNIPKTITNPETTAQHPTLDKTIKESVFSIGDARIYPEGSLLFTQDIREFPNYRAQRIAKIDKNSKLIWEIPGLFHHDLFLTENGTIYSVGSKLTDTTPLVDNTDNKQVKFISSVVNIISNDGQLLDEINVEDAFANSGYAHFLTVFNLDISPLIFKLNDGSDVYDTIHLNSAQPLTQHHADHWPIAQEGDILISLRGNSTIALLRPQTRNIIWAKRGPWRNQHFVRMQHNGTITIYDNDGGSVIASVNRDSKPTIIRQPRIVAYNPANDTSSIIYADYNLKNGYFASFWRGQYHFFDDNTMLVSSSNTGQIIHVDLNTGKKFWQLTTTENANRDEEPPYTKKLVSMHYYDPQELPFLSH